MRELALVEFLTLDGVMQGPASADEDRDGGFAHGGWGAPYGDEIMRARAAAGLSAGAYLFGRRTYERMAAHWPHESPQDPIAAHLNATPKYVATRTLTKLDWEGSQVLEGEVTEAVGALKQQGEGAITVLGSWLLAQTLIAAGLVDEYNLFIHPLVLGTGKRLFERVALPLRLRLLDCTPTSTGVLLCRYRPQ